MYVSIYIYIYVRAYHRRFVAIGDGEDCLPTANNYKHVTYNAFKLQVTDPSNIKEINGNRYSKKPYTVHSIVYSIQRSILVPWRQFAGRAQLPCLLLLLVAWACRGAKFEDEERKGMLGGASVQLASASGLKFSLFDPMESFFVSRIKRPDTAKIPMLAIPSIALFMRPSR